MSVNLDMRWGLRVTHESRPALLRLRAERFHRDAALDVTGATWPCSSSRWQDWSIARASCDDRPIP
jgi:hypothetical protein